MTYTDLGQLRREYHPEIEDAIDYSYDIHGWTKSISSQYFSEALFYADGPDTDYYCYNGDISSQLWMNADTAVWRGYKFKYNERDMLYQSSYGEGENLTLHTGRYNENITEFNSNGAIVRLTRRGKTNSDSYGIIDYLIYDYDGNKVTGIRDRYPTLLSYNGAFEYRNTHTATAAEPDFEYNSAGMLIKDRDKGISNITYNNIGLVEDIQFDNGARIAYVYSLTGEKLKVTHYSPLAFINPIRLSASQAEEGTTSSTDDRIVSPGIQYPSVIKSSEIAYLGGDVQIECMNGDYTHLFGGGYLKFNPDLMSVPKFYYYAKDHLGNIRSVATKTNGVVEEVQHTAYYPFGGIIADLSSGRDVQNHLYNGKELDYSNNLYWYDYGARQYDSTAPRFTTPDPLAEKYYGWNMYGYCMNNPIKFIDPDGRKIKLVGSENNCKAAVSIYNSGSIGGSPYYMSNGELCVLSTFTPENSFDKNICRIINDDKCIELNVVSGSNDVIIGDVVSSTIDVQDMQNLENLEYTSPAAAIFHETIEQSLIQDDSFRPNNLNRTLLAHGAAENMEHALNGQFGISNQLNIENGNGTLDFYKDNNVIESVKIEYGNVIKK